MLFSSEKIIRLESVGSTNEYMIEQIRIGKIVDEGTVLMAMEQTCGKGMDKNTWESEPGRNLTFSVLFKPVFLRADQQFMLNKSISLGVYDYVKTNVPHHKVSIKWPNDIYVEDRKIAGILISNTIGGSELLHSVAGIGMNINQNKFSDRLRNPVSLKHLIRKEIDLDSALHELLYFIENRYFQLVNNEFTRINTNFLESLYRLNELHLFHFKNERLTARITGVSDYGHLQLLSSTNEKIECDFKEIEFVI